MGVLLKPWPVNHVDDVSNKLKKQHGKSIRTKKPTKKLKMPVIPDSKRYT